MLHVLREMAITPNLFEDLKAMGRAEGRQADVLELFEMRFDVVPKAVRQAVFVEKDEGRLAAWFGVIVRATDQAEAMRIITGG